jgi:hypothetical protein
MARFPDCEAEFKALAQSIITGMTDSPDFPNPPVSPAELQDQLNSFISLGDKQIADQATAQQSTEAKQAGRDLMPASSSGSIGWTKPAAARLAELA